MRLSDEFREWCIDILQSPFLQQIAPLLVLLVILGLILTLTNTERSFLITELAMLLDGSSSFLPWNWSFGSTHSHSSSRSGHHGKGKKHHVRTRADQVAMNRRAKHGPGYDSEEEGYYSGLVNIPGNYCFMNSTLQALSSLSYLHPHIDAIHDKAERLDVPTPVIDALQSLFHRLNIPHRSRTSIEPREIIKALRQSETRMSQLLSSREHQDAQELFQLLSESIKNETVAVDKEEYKDRGLGGLVQSSEPTRELGKSVFDGLTANRRSCVECGYTEAVMHFAFDNWQLAVPRMASSVALEACLEEYTRLETLYDSTCRKCSLVATQRYLFGNIALLEEELKPQEGHHLSSKKRKVKESRLQDMRRQEVRVKSALDEGRIEDPLKDVDIQKIVRVSTKQAMIARPPQVLALHINRSVYGAYASKNSIFLHFPEVLDLTPYTTSGNLSTNPKQAISAPPTPVTRSTTPTPSTYTCHRTYYRLAAVVCHYGQHSFGHYICFRRKPRRGRKEWAPPRLVDPLTYIHDDGVGPPQYKWEGEQPTAPGTGWLRISDESVKECGIQTVVQEGSSAFMLYYEKVVLVREGIYPGMVELRGSEETLKPETMTVALKGSVASLVSEVGLGVTAEEKEEESESLVVPNGRLAESEIIGLGSKSTVVGKGGRIIRRAGTRQLRSPTPVSRESSLASTSLDPLSQSTPVLQSEKEKSQRLPLNGHALNGNGHPHHHNHQPSRHHTSSSSSSSSSTPKSSRADERIQSLSAPVAIQERRSSSHSSPLTNGHSHSSRLPPKHQGAPRIPSPPPSATAQNPRSPTHESGPSPIVGLKA